MGMPPDAPPVASPQTWAGWGLPAGVVADLFRAAAAYFHAAPWRDLADEQLLDAELPAGRRWTACVLGNGGFQFGLAWYADADDFLRMLEGGDDFAAAMSNVQAPILSLTYDRRADLPRRMQREVASAGWEVAGPNAYPTLIALNTPGGGISRGAAEDLTALLRSIPGFVEHHRAALRGEESAWLPLEWRDPETGMLLRYAGIPVIEEESIWEPPARLEPGGPEGPGAEPAVALDPPDDPDAFADTQQAEVASFTEWLRAQGLAQSTVEKHAANAEVFADFLARWQGVPLRAVTEYDLRMFLYDWYPRKVMDSRTRALSVPASLRRLFDYLEEAKEIACPWVESILRDKEAFEIRLETCPGGFWWDEAQQAWRGETYRDLDARVFLPDRDMAGGEWGSTMGMVEAQFYSELQRHWLLWRDDAIRDGTTEPEAVRAALIPRQREWEQAPHPAHGGKTPAQVIQAERKAQPRKP